MTIESFDDVESQLNILSGNLQGYAAAVDGIRIQNETILSDIASLRTEVANAKMGTDSVESRLTQIESSLLALTNQSSEVISQIQEKLSGALALKPEIMPYDYELSLGVTDEVTGLRLRADATAQRKFTGQFSLVSTAVLMGVMPQDAAITFWTYEGVPSQLPANQYIGLMFRYGAAIQAIEAKH